MDNCLFSNINLPFSCCFVVFLFRKSNIPLFQFSIFPLLVSFLFILPEVWLHPLRCGNAQDFKSVGQHGFGCQAKRQARLGQFLIIG